VSARAWDERLLEDAVYGDALDVADDPSWDDATELLWDEHLERQAGRRADDVEEVS